MSYLDYLKKFNETKEWKDYVEIYANNQVNAITVNNDLNHIFKCSLPWTIWTSTFNMLSHLYDIKRKYVIEGYSLQMLVDEYHFPKTSLNSLLKVIGLLRSKSQATINAMNYGRPIGGQLFYSYKLNGNYITLKSTYELAFIQQLKSTYNESDIYYESLSIPYIDPDGLTRNYVPDFKIKDIIFEVKPEAFLDDELNLCKWDSAKKFCKDNQLRFKIITEKEINWDKYPDWDDKCIEYTEPTHEDIVSSRLEYQRQTGDLYNNIEFDEHFISKIRLGEYNYKMHPRTNTDFSYDSLMNFINQHQAYTVDIWDIYDLCDRNMLIRRLRDEAPEDEKDIKYWMCKYLNDRSIYRNQFTPYKLKLQIQGIRNFNLKLRDDIILFVRTRDYLITEKDVFNYLGWGRNKSIYYLNEFSGLSYSELHEIIEENNSKIG